MGNADNEREPCGLLIRVTWTQIAIATCPLLLSIVSGFVSLREDMVRMQTQLESIQEFVRAQRHEVSALDPPEFSCPSEYASMAGD